jgi:hypothetical protein
LSFQDTSANTTNTDLMVDAVAVVAGAPVSVPIDSPCSSDTTQPVITFGIQPRLLWQQAVTPTAPVEGWTVQIDAGTPIQVPLFPATAVCANGSSGYVWQLPGSLAAGTHTVRLAAWNTAADGTRQEGVSTITFAVAGPPLQVPSAPLGIRVVP